MFLLILGSDWLEQGFLFREGFEGGEMIGDVKDFLFAGVAGN